MKLNEDNYYTNDANKQYMSVSLLKKFIGSPVEQACEKRALAELDGLYREDSSTAMMLGNYVDTCLLEPEKKELFIASHPEMFSTRGKTKGMLKSEYRKADIMIERCKGDSFFMSTLKGEHQVIMTADIFGVPFKCKMDVYRKGKYITDLKTTENIHKTFYDPATRSRMSFIEYYDYILQGAIYQEIVYQNTGERLPFFLSVVDKGTVPDIEVIQIDTDTLKDKLEINEEMIVSAWSVHQREVEPIGCGRCDYCKSIKKLIKPINWLEIGGEIDG